MIRNFVGNVAFNPSTIAFSYYIQIWGNISAPTLSIQQLNKVSDKVSDEGLELGLGEILASV